MCQADSLDLWWEGILQIKDLAKYSFKDVLALRYVPFTNTWEEVADGSPVDLLVRLTPQAPTLPTLVDVTLGDALQIHLESHGDLPKEVVAFLTLYLPYALQMRWAQTENKALAITHFAQTLDGRIAATSGDSKWIGNHENLKHAHRMRALCDAILVGKHTLLRDNPRLNVRMVTGDSPIPVIIGSLGEEAADFHAIRKETLVVCKTQGPLSICKYLEVSIQDEAISTHAILEALFQKGIYSVYVEGGSFTTSTFLQQGSITQAQVHISPMILGSGISGFSFPGISQMEDAIRFKTGRFVPIEDHVMYLGQF
ncbi:MAG TPA: hypothetical protein DCE41_17910 [Cytophagales bacterium]|nr:hypothetical protein [Cytophagales bacterium]HAA23651.1 hypothetical protein [Cytophagales bacterium]HAP65374.1 hypothetical protein [Cytophagales bacterium]